MTGRINPSKVWGKYAKFEDPKVKRTVEWGQWWEIHAKVSRGKVISDLLHHGKDVNSEPLLHCL